MLNDLFLDGGITIMRDFCTGFNKYINKMDLQTNTNQLHIIGSHPTKTFEDLLDQYYSFSEEKKKNNKFISPKETWMGCAMLITLHHHRRRQLKLCKSRDYELMRVFEGRLNLGYEGNFEFDFEELIHPFLYDQDGGHFYYTPYIIIDSETQIQALLASYLRFQVQENLSEESIEKFNSNDKMHDPKNFIDFKIHDKGALKDFDIEIQ
jgi:hypothetical protein